MSARTRRDLLLVAARCGALMAAAGLTGCGAPAGATPRKLHRVGWLLISPISDPIAIENLGAFRAGLRDLGYVEGENLVVEVRSANGRPERLPALAAELVAMRPDVLLSSYTPGVEALKDATRTIPIVFILNNPGSLIADMSHPGGNLTGIGGANNAAVDAKHLQLLKEAVPDIVRVALVRDPTDSATGPAWLAEMRRAASLLGIDLELTEVRATDDYAQALAAIAAARPDALVLRARTLALSRAAQIASFVLENALPSVLPGSEFVDASGAGGLLHYAGSGSAPAWRRAATYVDRILRGAWPGDLPVEQSVAPAKLTLNACTAARLGIRIPESLMKQASEVIQCASR